VRKNPQVSLIAVHIKLHNTSLLKVNTNTRLKEKSKHLRVQIKNKLHVEIDEFVLQLQKRKGKNLRTSKKLRLKKNTKKENLIS